ncbi:hypothetical protein FEZ53_10465 [Staphylococcus xylosus]|uniref:Uncharacterized protein n=1 Tax=Staphylococcus xylosus TaxID=1288 RepID=A0A5R9B203_STAXY|nr:hypothetical protein FEZ53_10465 [Staphylococcus xylosus]
MYKFCLKKIIVTAYLSHITKHIYSLGNALGLPVLAICIYLSILNFAWLPSFILLIILMLLMKLI